MSKQEKQANYIVYKSPSGIYESFIEKYCQRDSKRSPRLTTAQLEEKAQKEWKRLSKNGVAEKLILAPGKKDKNEVAKKLLLESDKIGKNEEFGSKTNNKPTMQNAGNTTPQKKTNPHVLQADVNNYKDTLLAYYKYMHQLPPQKEWMKYKFGLKIRDILDAKKDIKVLAIGTGAGDVDIDFLDEIVKCGKERLGEDGYSVVYQVVEPNPTNVETFRNRVAAKPEYHRITFQWCTGTFDKFMAQFKQKESEENRFDFVHFVRVFYHIDSKKAFDATYDHLLAKDGIMCGIGENEEAFWPKMMHFLAEHKMEHECFTCSGPVSQNYFLPGWLQQCRERDWRYESYVQGYKFDVTPIYDPENQDGNYLIDFVFHVKQSRKNVAPTVIEDFLKFVDAGKKERTVLQNGEKVVQKYYPCELGAIMITKE